jgi:hypothetical protein
MGWFVHCMPSRFDAAAASRLLAGHTESEVGLVLQQKSLGPTHSSRKMRMQLLCCATNECGEYHREWFALQDACSPEDPWADYEGVVRGVMEGGCDVGFTKHTTVLEVVQGGSAPAPWATVGAVSGIIKTCTAPLCCTVKLQHPTPFRNPYSDNALCRRSFKDRQVSCQVACQVDI